MKLKRILSMALTLAMVVSMCTVFVSTASAAVTTIYVSPNGNDLGNGSESSPYKTIAKARDVARTLPKPVNVILKEGTYYLTQALNFTSADSNVSYIGEEGKAVNIYGSTRIDPSKITSASDSVANRVLNETAKSKLMVMDLSSYFTGAIPKYYSKNNVAEASQYELTFYCGDTALKRSRWPNTGYVLTQKGSKPTVSGSTHTYVLGDQGKAEMAKWAANPNLFVLGFWGYEYNCESCGVTTFNKSTGTFSAVGGVNSGDWTHAAALNTERRVYFFNLPEEIDQPGECYIDYSAKKVYFYPPDNFNKNDVCFSTITTALFNFRDTTNVTLKNLNIKYCRRNAIDIRGSGTSSSATEDGNQRVFNIENCTIAHTSWTAITYYGIGLTVKNCKIYDTACGGVSVIGGVRKSLTSGNSAIINTSIESYNRSERTYNSAIGAGAVGMKITNCTIGYGIHEGIGISTNDVEISKCKFHHLVTETSDMGAIYYGRDPSILGIKIHNNYFYEIGNSYGYTGQQSIYMDDGSMGADIYSNIFVNAGGRAGSEPAAIKSHGAQFASVHDNIFVDTDSPNYYGFDDAAYGKSGSGVQTDWAKMVAGQGGSLASKWPLARKKITDVEASSATWKNHYNGTIWANLFNYINSYNESNVPNKSNEIKNNVLVNMKGTAMAIWKNPNYTESNNVTLTENIFADYSGKNFGLSSSGLSTIQAKIPNFADPEFANMGTQGTIGAVSDGGGYTPEPTPPIHIHTPGAAATCTTAQVCTSCGQTITPALGHNYNASGVCTRCGAQKEVYPSNLSINKNYDCLDFAGRKIASCVADKYTQLNNSNASTIGAVAAHNVFVDGKSGGGAMTYITPGPYDLYDPTRLENNNAIEVDFLDPGTVGAEYDFSYIAYRVSAGAGNTLKTLDVNLYGAIWTSVLVGMDACRNQVAVYVLSDLNADASGRIDLSGCSGNLVEAKGDVHGFKDFYNESNCWKLNCTSALNSLGSVSDAYVVVVLFCGGWGIASGQGGRASGMDTSNSIRLTGVNITATSQSGGTPGGHTHSMQATAAKAATCKEAGNIAYWYCSGCQKYFSDANGNNQISQSLTVIPKTTNHSFGSTYSSDATGHWTTCTVCGTKNTVNSHIPNASAPTATTPQYCVICNYVISSHTHTMQATAAKAATCKEAGNTAYWYCTGCQKYFSDANGKNEITKSSTVISKTTNHSFGSTYSSDATGHWTTCTVCGTKNTVNSHVPNASAPTSTTPQYCVICNYVISSVVHTHTMQATAAKAATCKEAGNTAYWYCTSCHKYFSDANGKNEITQASTVIPKKTTHSFGTTYSSDATGHWTTCTVCGTKSTVNAHVYNDPSATDKYCVICGYAPTPEKLGDADGDGNITVDDVTYVINYVMFGTIRPEHYPVMQNMDYDGDGKVTIADAVYLLNNLLFK